MGSGRRYRVDSPAVLDLFFTILERPRKISELVKLKQKDRTTLSQQLNVLVDKGLLKREVDKDNRFIFKIDEDGLKRFLAEKVVDVLVMPEILKKKDLDFLDSVFNKKIIPYIKAFGKTLKQIDMPKREINFHRIALGFLVSLYIHFNRNEDVKKKHPELYKLLESVLIAYSFPEAFELKI